MDASKNNQRMIKCQYQVIWCPREVGGYRQIESYPERCDAERFFILTNDVTSVEPLFSGTNARDCQVIDIAELYRLLFPENSAQLIDEMLPSPNSDVPDVQRLWRLWQLCYSKLDALPAWILDIVAIICRERDENALSELFLYLSAGRGDENRKWSKFFPRTVTKVERPRLPELTDCSALDIDFVAGCLAPNGALSKLVKDYEPRPGQIQMLKAVVDAFNTGRHLVVEAGTGIGKSLAYLLPAALWARVNDVPVVISTNTKNLQTQLVEKDLPAVLKVMDSINPSIFPNSKPLVAAVIKGRTNYICLRRLGQLIEQGQFELNRGDLRLLAQTLCWVANTLDGDLDSLTGGASVDPSFMQLITCSSDECAGHACRNYSQCFVQKARERSLRANLIIANHSLVFTETDAEQPVAIPAHAQIIFDEAHNLEEAATRFFTAEFSPSVLGNALKRLANKRGTSSHGALHQLQRRLDKGVICSQEPEHSLMGTAIEKALSAVEKIKRTGNAVFTSLHPLLGQKDDSHRYAFEQSAPITSDVELLASSAPDDMWRVIREKQSLFREAVNQLLKLLGAINDIIVKSTQDELNLAEGETADLVSAVKSLENLRDTADMVLSGAGDDYVYWVQPSRSAGAVGEACAAPLNVGKFLSTNLYKKMSSVILCSATLSVAGRFTYIASRLGLNMIDKDRLNFCIAPSPFDYINQCALVVPQYLPEPVSQDRSYVTELANLICQLAIKYDGRTLCLFTSYEMLKTCARLIEDILSKNGIHLLIHGESGSRNKLTNTFRKGDRCVLLGTQSFWEGVDVVGDALSCVVVARLPFTSPSDPVMSARCEQIEKSGQSSFHCLSLPAAVLRLRQGFGRLIRHRNDRGCVVIADTRLITKGYGAVFRNSLPAPLKKCADSQAVLDAFEPPPSLMN